MNTHANTCTHTHTAQEYTCICGKEYTKKTCEHGKRMNTKQYKHKLYTTMRTCTLTLQIKHTTPAAWNTHTQNSLIHTCSTVHSHPHTHLARWIVGCIQDHDLGFGGKRGLQLGHVKIPLCTHRLTHTYLTLYTQTASPATPRRDTRERQHIVP